MTGVPWWRALPAVETWVPCGDGLHPVRWQDGALTLPAHADPEGEAVLAALGGERAACLEVAEAWHRHDDDLDLLAVGPRGPDDDVGVSWDEVREFRENRLGSRFARRLPGSGGFGAGLFAGTGRPGSRPMIPAGGRPGGGGLPPGPPPELAQLRAERLEMLILLALGSAFQQLLSGTIAAAWADGGLRAGEAADHRPALEAALTGRLAPAAKAWLGVDPDLVEADLAEAGRAGEHSGWGELGLTGSRAGARLRATLPVGWLATVWAPGLAVVDGHLVVAVEQAAWPDATVLAVPAPGRPPVRLRVRAVDGETGIDVGGPGHSAQWAHWETTDSQEGGQR